MKRNPYAFPFGALTGIIYFAVSFLTGAWEYTWLIFLANPIFYWLTALLQQDRKSQTKLKDDDDDDDDDMLDF
ncbi:MAG: hypothetical protein LBV19_11130 [Streptococcaceae bacterium]|jgi:hypothetical protein|nr:hypothetical protein [Streptococcaceae bacterium]